MFIHTMHNHESHTATINSHIFQLAVTALLEVVESGSKNLEVAVVRRGGELQFFEESVIDALVLQIEADKEAAAAAAAAAGGPSSLQSAGKM